MVDFYYKEYLMSMTPKVVNGALILFSLLGFGIGVYFVCCCEDDFLAKFNKLSECLFSAFLTISSFLFAFETFIIFKVKEGVYDSSVYREKYKKYIKENDPYANLKRFSNFLLKGTAFSFFTAILLLVYIMGGWICMFPFCLAFIFLSVTSLVIAWKLMKDNLDAYFNSL